MSALDEHLFDGLLRTGSRRSRRGRLWLAAFIVLCAVVAIWQLRSDNVPTENAAADAGLLTLEAPRIDLDRVPEGSGPEVARSAVETGIAQGTIQSGQSLSAALVAQGVRGSAVHAVVQAMSGVFDFRRSQPGHTYQAQLDSDGNVTYFRYQTAPETIYEARLLADGTWEANQVPVDLQVREEVIGGVIETSLIAAVVGAGQREALASSFASILQWDVDFSREVRAGDAFRMLYEAVYLDGEFLRYGRILAAEFRGARKQAAGYWFAGEGADPGYYTAEGSPLERMFLAAPCRYRRISSAFNPNRMHPVLNVRRPHLGVDYAAPTGTPVYSVADGTVLFVGVRGGNGNLVRIRHAHGYESGYAHLSRFARGLRAGQEVEQGELIGYVGSTGLSTGPHLHFGLKYRDRYIDPLSHQNTRAPSLTGRAQRDFLRVQAQLQTRLEQVPLADVQIDTAAEVFAEESLDGFHGGEFEGEL